MGYAGRVVERVKDDGTTKRGRSRNDIQVWNIHQGAFAIIDTLTRSRWIRTTTAAGLVPLLLMTSGPACALRSDQSSMPAEGWTPQAAQRQRQGGLGSRAVPADAQPASGTLFEWSRVEAVPVGTQTEVQLHDDEAPPDSRRVTGRFHAATADTLTLALEELTSTSSTRTLVKSAVQSVSVRRPIRKRYAGWFTLLAGTVILASKFSSSGDLDPWGAWLFGAAHAAPISLFGFFLDRRQRIYEVPPRPASLPSSQEGVSKTGP